MPENVVSEKEIILKLKLVILDLFFLKINFKEELKICLVKVDFNFRDKFEVLQPLKLKPQWQIHDRL